MASDDPQDKRERKYILDMFPYPSGQGLHVGHPKGYLATDTYARYLRMRGFNVLHPFGWDAFGLPAEQYALKTGCHPSIAVRENIERFKKQTSLLGLGFDWEREINTTDPAYFRWTQWIFLQLYDRGLAYQAEVPVNWCPELGTVLANEEVIDGVSERGGYPVFRRPLRQWMLRITKYADALLDDLEELDWPEAVKEMQRHWIGRSVGAEISFSLCNNEGEPTGDLIQVFTTRPDTLGGATYMVLAPEHPLVEKITTPTQKEKVVAYALKASRLSDRERTGALGENDEKTGVDTGAKAINPLTGSLIPVWIGDYVLGHYGTGAIMSVPAHDQRDWLFATRQNLPIIPVVTPPKNISHDFSHSAFEGDGASLSPGGKYLPTPLAKESVISWLVEEHLGKKTTTYRLRDWLFSRQRYWGEPIPLISDGLGHFEPLDEKELPLTLPDLDEIRPPGDGRSPLALAEDWVETSRGKRETHTMPQWAGSCWYYLRYLDPKNEEMLVSKEKEATWMPVDLYVGGAEHAVLHLLYARFWHKVLYDIGVVSTKEPFKKLINVGMIQGCDGQKMSKSKGNVVNPDDVIERFGADAFRMYEMFMGPFTGSAPWNTDGIPGIRRFLGRAWRLLLGRKELVGDSLSQTIRHQTILKVSEDIDRFRFNTAISALMVYLNSLEEQGCSLADRKTFLRLLTPFAPHMAEEIHQRLEWEGLAALAPWPQANEESAQESRVTVPVMVNGKLRATLDLPVDCPETTVREHALSEENVQRHLGSKKPRRIIIVTNRVINIVI